VKPDLAAMADELMRHVRQLAGPMEADDAKALRAEFMDTLTRLERESSRAWLGSALTRGRGDD
jgi:hypothetical protein